ncbi:glycosyltransferase [Haloferax sp. MBLA0078]|uniref:Glycosyltransferase n=1 Tax=Haloferax marinum TaxID=2666143 RepID=A0A6A8GB44_9EURY|nr:glycosyltransferase family 2 protein [Haloferax sp. CBA1150]MRW98127.1 glycosyltransferase [Haloferax marinum]
MGVVVPAYNEERFVGTVIDTIPEFVDRTYVIDDHSTDGTWREITVHAARVNDSVDHRSEAREPTQLTADGGELTAGRVVAIRHPTNRGRGASVKAGYQRALEDGMDIIVVMDGDGQMDPDILTTIIDPVVDGTADYAVGDRLAGPSYWHGMPPWRLFGNTLLSGLTRIASGYWHIRDPQNGYTAISASALAELDLDRLYDKYGFLNDVLVHLNVAEKRVATVPMYARYGDEESGIRYSSFVPGLSFLLLKDFVWRLRVKYLDKREYAPVLAYVIGVLSVLAGVVRFSRGVLEQSRPSGSVIRIFGGVLALGSAMLLDKRLNEHLQQVGTTPDVFDSSARPTDPEVRGSDGSHRDDEQAERVV